MKKYFVKFNVISVLSAKEVKNFSLGDFVWKLLLVINLAIRNGLLQGTRKFR